MNKIQKFMKKLNVLYVEDEKPAREMFSKILNRQFTNVTICENGLDGYLAYKENSDKETKFDLIISDINMPKMSGIELVEKVREENSEVLIILVTARNEASVIMRALELQVTNYITKPMDLTKTNETIIKTCEKLYLKSVLDDNQKQLEKYTKTIEDIALVMKINEEHNVTDVNDVFCSTTGLKKEEVVDKSVDFIFKGRSEKQKNDMWDSLKLGNTWKDTVKSTTINDEVYYVKATIIPFLNEDDNSINEFMFIGFITTDEEKKKQELNKKLLHNIADSKKDKYNIEKEKKSYEENINILRTSLQHAEERQASLLKNNENLLTQLEAYESSKLSNTSTHTNVLKSKNDEIDKLQKLVSHFKNDKVESSKNIKKLEETLASKNHTIEFLEESHKKDRTKIDNLKGIIMDLENNKNGKKTF
ncbi:response regulator [Arcobacter peruensis]|uniref:response regulator n=1 Tax=Arcobacter peruensis TaxID=2320140 RepID=UPI000F073AB8|nr:response regulator [Arcobacter peruensis]